MKNGSNKENQILINLGIENFHRMDTNYCIEPKVVIAHSSISVQSTSQSVDIVVTNAGTNTAIFNIIYGINNCIRIFIYSITYRYYKGKQQENKPKPYFDLCKVWIISFKLFDGKMIH